jgi:hypothetical protein
VQPVVQHAAQRSAFALHAVDVEQGPAGSHRPDRIELGRTGRRRDRCGVTGRQGTIGRPQGFPVREPADHEQRVESRGQRLRLAVRICATGDRVDEQPVSRVEVAVTVEQQVGASRSGPQRAVVEARRGAVARRGIGGHDRQYQVRAAHGHRSNGHIR